MRQHVRRCITFLGLWDSRFRSWAKWIADSGTAHLIDQISKIGLVAMMAVIVVYIRECGQRRRAAEDQKRARYYQAWQTINSAAGKGGDGGRRMALEDLNQAGISLARVNLSDAVFFGLRLTNAELVEATFDSAVLTGAVITNANLHKVYFARSKFYDCDFRESTFSEAQMGAIEAYNCNFAGCFFASAYIEGRFLGCDFTGANLRGARLSGGRFEAVNFAHANLEGIDWGRNLFDHACNLYGVTNAPPEFIHWAKTNGMWFTNITGLTAWEKFHGDTK